jgi:hypothetical protein
MAARAAAAASVWTDTDDGRAREVGAAAFVVSSAVRVTASGRGQLCRTNGRYVAMQMAITIKRRSIGLGPSVPYTSHAFWLSVPAVGGAGRLPATDP